MVKFPKPGTAAPIKKVLGALLLLSGFITIARPNFVTVYWLWDIVLAVLLFASAYFLLIGGRQK